MMLKRCLERIFWWNSEGLLGVELRQSMSDAVETNLGNCQIKSGVLQISVRKYRYLLHFRHAGHIFRTAESNGNVVEHPALFLSMIRGFLWLRSVCNCWILRVFIIFLSKGEGLMLSAAASVRYEDAVVIS